MLTMIKDLLQMPLIVS